MALVDYTTLLKRFVESNVPLIINFALTSMYEVMKLIDAGEGLWIPNGEGGGYVLNEYEYFKAFPTAYRTYGLNCRNEGSRLSIDVKASPSEIVEVFTDMRKYLAVYPNFVSKANIMSRHSTKDGVLLLMCVEFQVPCPVIPTREIIFIRYCKRLTQEIWAIVDVSPNEIYSNSTLKCLRRPSGGLIQKLPNGFSKVTWIEHVAVNDQDVRQPVEHILQSRDIYGATRWMSTLKRQCERIAYSNTGIMDGNREKSMILLKLSERMYRGYFGTTTTFNANEWTHVTGGGIHDVKIIKMDNVNDAQWPFGVILSASLSIQLPIPSKNVCAFIRNIANRPKWDVFCNGAENIQEIFRFATGQRGDHVSVLRVTGNEDPQSTFIMQETTTEPTSTSIIYVHLGMGSMMKMLSYNSNPDTIKILPRGFTIVPMKLPVSALIRDNLVAATLGGTLLTASFKFLASPFPYQNLSDQSIEFAQGVVTTAVKSINDALLVRNG